MAHLIEETSDAAAWVQEHFSVPPRAESLGRLLSAVIWTDSHWQDGEPIGGDDPAVVVNEINEQGLPLLHGHDPGRPAGRIIAARAFTSPSGVRFVATILAYYTPELALSFYSLGVDPFPTFTLPISLPSLDGVEPQFGVDRRDVTASWIAEVLEDTPFPVTQVDLSHNDAESLKELVRIGLPYAALVWNPAAKAIGEQAGKDIYAAIQHWLQRIWKKVEKLRGPIVDVQAHYHHCTVSFLLRGRDVDQHYAAHAALPAAAAQAAQLIDNFRKKNLPLNTLTYEFEQGRWFPSYGIVVDGRIISDPGLLIAFEQIPKSLSIGLLRKNENPER
jgi:hypothetical protein